MIKKWRNEIAHILTAPESPGLAPVARMAQLSYNTVKAATNPDGGLNCDSLERISKALLWLPGKGKTCTGCAYDYGEDDENPGGIICAMAGAIRDGDGCGHWVKEGRDDNA